MKRIVSLVLVCALLLSGCGQQGPVGETSHLPDSTTPTWNGNTGGSDSTTSEQVGDIDDEEADNLDQQQEYLPEMPGFTGLNDPTLLRYAQDTIYSELVNGLDSSDYFIENVSAVYVSKEYLEEIAFNSQSNIFFGYTLEELDAEFQGTRYVFTLTDDGKTGVVPFEAYDDTYERVIKNVAIGTGVILVCVTVSVVSGGVGAPAVSMIFAASAKTGTIFALSSGTIGGIAAGVATGIQTGDFDAALKAGVLAGSEGFMWGAITGVVSGGASEAIALKGATLNGLTMNEAAAIQKESGYPLDVIKQFASMDQYEICREAGLTSKMINGQTALIRDIDLNFVDEMGRTNLERMQQGLAALDPSTGLSYELHHIGQEVESTLAILTKAEHMQNGNNLIWHDPSIDSVVHAAGNTWNAQKQAFWREMAKILAGGGI